MLFGDRITHEENHRVKLIGEVIYFRLFVIFIFFIEFELYL